MREFILLLMPFVTILIFVGGMGYRIYTWVRTPQPGKMTLFPAPRAGKRTLTGVVKESFLFSGLFKGDRTLWSFAWIFHLSLAFILIGHIRVFTDFPALWQALGIDADKMSAVSGGSAGILIMIFTLLLLLRRLGLKRVREISNIPDFLAILLILAIIVTGNWMRFAEHFDLNQTRLFFAHLVSFSFSKIQIPQSNGFILHFFLVQLLLIFIPFSKILHFGGIFFTQTLIQRT